MAEINQTYGVNRRRVSDSLHGHGRGLSTEQRLAERAQEYDRALRQSQNAAVRRRQGSKFSGNAEAHQQQGHGQLPTVASSAADSTSTTTLSPPPVIAVEGGGLMESNINPFPSELNQESRIRQEPGSQATIAQSDELSREGEMGSELGESYVDGAKAPRSRPSIGPSNSQREENAVVPEQGVMDLLAQIYGTRGPRMI